MQPPGPMQPYLLTESLHLVTYASGNYACAGVEDVQPGCLEGAGGATAGPDGGTRDAAADRRCVLELVRGKGVSE